MITLPITCKQLMYGLWLLWGGLSTIPIFTVKDDPLTQWIFLIIWTVVSAEIFIVLYLCEHEFPIRCKCDGK